MIEIVKSKLLQEAGIAHHGFTKRQGGTSPGDYSSLNLAFDVGDDDANVTANLKALKEATGALGPLMRVRQVHGGEVVGTEGLRHDETDNWTARPNVEADGIVCGKHDDAYIAVQTADCAPVLLADPDGRNVAALHAGWRGLSKGVIRAGVRELAALGATPMKLIAVIGPTICAKCYEVGKEVARHFPESVDPIKGSPDKFLLDLPYAVEVSLIAAGLTSQNIERLPHCPKCHPDDFFSYRAAEGTCGRGLGYISSRV